MQALIFTTDRNRPGKKDYTGAFGPHARRFAETHRIERSHIHKINVGVSKRRQCEQVLSIIRDSRSLDCVAFFCHGYKKGIEFGLTTRNVDKLAETLAETARRNLNIPLYACSTAGGKRVEGPGGDGDFADELRDALCRVGINKCRVMGHATAGHTTKNPHVRFFDGFSSDVGGFGGYWVVRPRGPLWRKWISMLRERESDFCYKFPFYDVTKIWKKLSK